ncbi:hypothetical protein D7Y27_12325 [Corallococcus sp. AB004]|nr:hypothetical protein D7Y27_12325 [Corallococcus sp. AB004]
MHQLMREDPGPTSQVEFECARSEENLLSPAEGLGTQPRDQGMLVQAHRAQVGPEGALEPDTQPPWECLAPSAGLRQERG